jgi:NodT family efflux transporter outer membrane factor (OMF) lipoprotein
MSKAKRVRHGLGKAVATGMVAMTVLVGCATGPRFTPPPTPTVSSYVSSRAGNAHSEATSNPHERPAEAAEQSVILGMRPPEDWWTLLNSPQLDEVVALALRNNLSLGIARANLSRAQEGLAAVRGQRSVQLDLASQVARNEYGSAFLGPEASTFPTFSDYSVGPSVSYDLDIFGELRHRVEQAGALSAYERQQLRAARLQVLGDTVTEVLDIASTRARIRVIKRIVDSDEKTLDLVRAARRVGVVSDIDVLTAESQRDRDRTLLPPLYQELDTARDALAILVGRPPVKWAAPDFALDELSVPYELSLVVPSELVRARPDIRAAEAELRSANATVGIATADLYPHVSLTAGWAQQELLTGGTAAAWSLVGGLTAPVFHGGTLRAQRRAAQDAYNATFLHYQLVVLNAFGQVADTLHSLDHDAQALRTQEQAVASAEATVRLTQQGYRVGNAGILQVVTAERERQVAEIGLVQARARRVADTAALFLASGNGA